jgi:hypothetical protein
VLYQFLCWRQVRPKIVYSAVVEDLIGSLKALNDGQVPTTLGTWGNIQAFAGKCKIGIPEMEAVARSISYSARFPSIKWLEIEYQKFLARTLKSSPKLLESVASLVAAV